MNAAGTIRASRDKVVFGIIAYAVVTVISVLCILPFWLMIVGSFTDELAIHKYGYGFWPKVFSLAGYKSVFNGDVNVFKAYEVSVSITAIGTVLGLLIMIMAAYAIQRKDLKHRHRISFFFYFTTLFNGGLVAYYLTITSILRLTDSYLAILLPVLCTPWLIILLRTFIQSIPDSISEAALMDGASDFRILFTIVVPLSQAGLATIGLFLALAYWNDWFNASLFLNKRTMWPLQYFLQNVIMNAQAMLIVAEKGGQIQNQVRVPLESVKMATAVVATGPIILLYPFVQKYFVKGLTIGSVKG